MLFTQSDCPLIEINFRNHWYCDPVCDDHYYGRISINCKCSGSRTNSFFHKADYHNLCHLINKKYIEIEAEKYSEGFTARNPISKKKIYIDGQNLLKHINTFI